MKKAKGLLTVAIVFSILVSNIGWASANSEISVAGTHGGGYSTLEEPNPVGH